MRFLAAIEMRKLDRELPATAHLVIPSASEESHATHISLGSFHLGFPLLTKSSLFLRVPALICFSPAIAS